MASQQDRLQKILAHAGVASRRASEDLIRQGRVTVNGQVAHLGQKADPRQDQIAVDGQQIQVKQEHTYIALYKPTGVISSARDTHGRPTVLGLVKSSARLYPVGRLDMDSEGLILLTDDGELAQLLMHPRYEHDKEYKVCLAGRPGSETLKLWRQGVLLDDRRTSPADVAVLRRERYCTWLRVIIHEGRKRQLRRIAKMLGYPAQRIIRVRIGSLRLGKLEPGEWRHLSEQEITELKGLSHS